MTASTEGRNRRSPDGTTFEPAHDRDASEEKLVHLGARAPFEPVLQAQRDHGAAHGQHHCVDLFQMLLDRTSSTPREPRLPPYLEIV